MAIRLSDLPAAVADYVMNNVRVSVGEVTYGTSRVLQPREKGTFNVTVTNTGAVRLTDLVYELSVAPSSIAKLVAPAGLVTVASDRLGGDPIPNGSEVDRLFLSGLGDVSWTSVDGGASTTTADLQVKTQEIVGDATIRCTLHASVDQSSLFQVEQAGSTATRTLTVG